MKGAFAREAPDKPIQLFYHLFMNNSTFSFLFHFRKIKVTILISFEMKNIEKNKKSI